MNDLDWTEVTRARDRRRRASEPTGSREDREKNGEGTPEPEAAHGPKPAPPKARRHKPPTAGPKQTERHRRLRKRTLPLIALAGGAFVLGAMAAAESPEEKLVEEFVASWARQDFAAMHRSLTPDAQERYSEAELAEAYRDAQATATATAIDPGDASESSDGARVEVGIRTTLFGVVEDEIEMPVSDDRVQWEPHMAFPGLRAGEELGRRLELGRRASILAADGTALAEGGGRTSPLGGAATDIAGEVGVAQGELRETVEESGYSPTQPTGVSGLELAFNPVLAGTPSGELLAFEEGADRSDPETEARVLATGEGEPGRNVRTTVDPSIQETAVSALGGRSGGIAVLDARNGRVKALAGQAFSNPQPPGSTFKVVTAVAALEEKLVKLDDEFPVVQSINAGGRVMENAHEEFCGGDFVETFAHSCNTVFGPLGVEVGEDKLVDTAQRFGFNEEPTLFDAEATKRIDPPAPSIPEDPGSDVDLAATSIGQGRLLATPLSMASVAQTIAAGGRRFPTPIVRDPELAPDAEPVQATTPEIAKILRSMMRSVVTSGTGSRAAVDGLPVAGKTGTAELGPKPDQPPAPPVAPGEEPPDPEQILDAWFIAFAPEKKPRLAIAVMLIDADADGGEVAAPIAAEVLAAALG